MKKIKFFNLFLAVIFSVAFIGIFWKSFPTVFAATTEDWPTYLHDISRSGASGDTNLNTGNVSQLVKLWSFKTGDIVAAPPAVVGGVVYVGSWDGYEYALDAN